MTDDEVLAKYKAGEMLPGDAAVALLANHPDWDAYQVQHFLTEGKYPDTAPA